MQRTSDRRAPRLISTLSELRKEVRKLSQRARRVAIQTPPKHTVAYRQQLLALFEEWIGLGNTHCKVLSFAAAVELGLSLQHHHVQCCHAAVVRDGTEALRVLFWAAAHRLRSRQPPWLAQQTLEYGDTSHPPNHAAKTPPRELCRFCAMLSRDPLRGVGHARLHPTGDVSLRTFGGSAFFEVQEFRCSRCQMNWAKRRGALEAFTAWALA